MTFIYLCIFCSFLCGIHRESYKKCINWLYSILWWLNLFSSIRLLLRVTSHWNPAVVNVWKAAFFKYFLPLSTLEGLPEGVSEVQTPSFQLFWVVGSHVRKFSEDVKVRGVSWWTKRENTTGNDDENHSPRPKALWRVKTSF